VFLDDPLRHRTPDADVVVLAVGLLDLIVPGEGLVADADRDLIAFGSGEQRQARIRGRQPAGLVQQVPDGEGDALRVGVQRW